LIDEIPQETLAPYFESNQLSEEELAKSGPSYRKKLMERRQKLQTGSATNQVNAGIDMASSVAPAAPATKPVAAAEEVSPLNEDLVTGEPNLEIAAPVPENATAYTPDPIPQQANSLPQASTIQQPASGNSNQIGPEESRQKIRTLMGLLLKHRGGPGFGKGRLEGPEIDRFDSLLQEVSAVLREEAKAAQPVDGRMTSTQPLATANDVVMPSQYAAAASSAKVSTTSSESASFTSVDSTIACIEGAITMYKNSPPELKQSVLVTLRAALVSAVDTCNKVLVSQPPPAIPGNPDGIIDNTIAVIEGAVTMYRNSPPGLKESVLVTLRAALISAVETCSIVLGSEQQATSLPPPPPTQVADQTATTVAPQFEAPTQQQSFPEVSTTSAGSVVVGTDPNSRRLEEIYEKVASAAGDGRLGLRRDLKPEEANELADQLVEMRSLLMEELEAGIPDPEPVLQQTTAGGESSAASKYQQMLAKARAEKAAG
jgi:hypothetical protein